MKRKETTANRVASLVQSLDKQLRMLETAHQLQFDSTASLRDKLLASKQAKSALNEARRLCDEMADLLSFDQ